MHLGKMDKKAMTLQYACAESLRQDCKLFYHNSSIFNGPHSPITSSAKKMLTICDKELAQVRIRLFFQLQISQLSYQIL